METRFLHDNPITNNTEDILGFKDFVKLVDGSLKNTETPFVYGVLGDWGSGKTSILRLLETRLNKDFANGTSPLIPIWFNVWQYENETNIIYPLLYAIRRDYDNRVKLIDKTREFGEKFFQVVAASTLALTDVGLRAASKYLTGEALKLKDVEERIRTIQEHPGELDRILGNWADQVTKLHTTFEKLLDIYARDIAVVHRRLRKDDIQFVILVDDLDRCLPDTTIAILESIKNYLAVHRCIYVFGLNPKVVYQGIRAKYTGLEINGREYLEKILNYSFYVPEPKTGSVAQFATNRLEKLVLDSENRAKYKKYFVTFGQVLEICQFRNPRKIKRILNHYLLFLGRFENEIDKYFNENTVRLIILAEYFPSLFQLFLSDDAAKIKAKLVKIGASDFDVKEFEEKFGLSIMDSYPQLTKMSKLFDLTLPTDENNPSLVEHARAVLNITRLV